MVSSRQVPLCRRIESIKLRKCIRVKQLFYVLFIDPFKICLYLTWSSLVLNIVCESIICVSCIAYQIRNTSNQSLDFSLCICYHKSHKHRSAFLKVSQFCRYHIYARCCACIYLGTWWNKFSISGICEFFCWIIPVHELSVRSSQIKNLT